MAYKFKPNKSVAKRFKVTGTGKLKRGHTKKTHLRSGHARNMRKLMGLSGVSPKKVAHERALRAAEKAEANPVSK
jgi:large subunit ribosomal protein L35